jgi:L-seryl-tRNA(Ser) seleniumtransferase
MDASDRAARSRLINARGTFTPLGVSRSSVAVRDAVASALADFCDMDEMQRSAGDALAAFSGAEAGTVVHCASAAITVAVAAAMTRGDADLVQRLPDATGLPRDVVLPAIHAVNYGHPITQAIRLAGAHPVLAGNDGACTTADIAAALAGASPCCLLLVSSRLTRGEAMDFGGTIQAARQRGVPVIIDGAAQDFRIRDLVALGADLVLVSGQKYLGGPTAGIIVGRAGFVAAVRAQEKGIGRGMKASKEAIAGVIAAVRERQLLDETAWRTAQDAKTVAFIARANGLGGVTARAEPDPTGLPFSRVHIAIDPAVARHNAAGLVGALKDGVPAIFVMDHRVGAGEIVLELVQLRDDEIAAVLERIAALVGPEVSSSASV